MDYTLASWTGDKKQFDFVSIDTIAFSTLSRFNQQAFFDALRPFLLCDETKVAIVLEDKGFNFYEKSLTVYYIAGEKTQQKMIKIGYTTNNGLSFGQKKYNEGYVVHIYGKGCAQIQIVQFLKYLEEKAVAMSLNITRLDVAYDAFKGQLKLQDISAALMSGAFNTRGFAPKLRIIANQSINSTTKRLVQNEKGDTLEIGSALSLNRIVAYEKGCEQKTTEGRDWVRLELRLKGDKIRPLTLQILENFEGLLFEIYRNSSEFFEIANNERPVISKLHRAKKLIDYSKIQNALNFARRNAKVLREILFNDCPEYIERFLKELSGLKVNYFSYVYS